MSLILAIEPDRAQAVRLDRLIRDRVRAELVHAETTERALAAIGDRVPDLVLVPSLLSPQEDAALAGALRVIATAAHVRMLTIPVLAAPKRGGEQRGVLSKWRRRPDPTRADGCDPSVFADQIATYLEEAAAERALDAAVESERALRAEEPKEAPRAARETPEDEQAPEEEIFSLQELDVSPDGEATAEEAIADSPAMALPHVPVPPEIETDAAAADFAFHVEANVEAAAVAPIGSKPRAATPIEHVAAAEPEVLATAVSDRAVAGEPHSIGAAQPERTAAAETDTLATAETDTLATAETDTLALAAAETTAPIAAADVESVAAVETETLAAAETETLATSEADALAVVGTETLAAESVETFAATEVEPVAAAQIDAAAVRPVDIAPALPEVRDTTSTLNAEADGEATRVERAELASRLDALIARVRGNLRPSRVRIAAAQSAKPAIEAPAATVTVATPVETPVVSPPAIPATIAAAATSDRIAASAPAATVTTPPARTVQAAAPSRPTTTRPEAGRGWNALVDALRRDLERQRSEAEKTEAPARAAVAQRAEPEKPAVSVAPEALPPAPRAISEPEPIAQPVVGRTIFVEDFSSRPPRKGRAVNTPRFVPVPARRKGPQPAEDEWGLFDPKQCGFAALLAKLDELTDAQDEASA